MQKRPGAHSNRLPVICLEDEITSSELVKALALEYPTGVSFAPIAIRLLRQKALFRDCEIDILKAEMFQLENGLWFSREMILDDTSHLELLERAENWLIEYGCFSVERLFDEFDKLLSNISTPEDFAAFLRYQSFTVGAWEKVGLFCFQPSSSLNEHLSQLLDQLNQTIQNAEGMIALNEIEEVFPHICPERLEQIRNHVMQGVHAVEIGGVPCWCSADVIPLPEDFPDILTSVIDTLVELGENLSISKLEFALNLFYRTLFREEYALQDNDTFLRVCAKHYQGRNEVIPIKRKLHQRKCTSTVPARRVHSQKTHFANLGVPIGAKLVFSKNQNLTCRVLDDSKLVEFNGETMSISALTTYLLGTSADYIYYFIYEGEFLWKRRLREAREKKQGDDQVEKRQLVVDVLEVAGGIIGMGGRKISPATWRAYQSVASDPRVAKWAERVTNGESIESIARESGLIASTVKQYIINRRIYYEICDRNGILPQDKTGV